MAVAIALNESCLGVKGQSNSEIASCLRNLFKQSLPNLSVILSKALFVNERVTVSIADKLWNEITNLGSVSHFAWRYTDETETAVITC